jgi:carboxyvinyl-carboxyphosphonate phosphorylmutase
MESRKKLVDDLKNKRFIIAPGAYDALTAKIIENVGFRAVYMTGAGVSYSTLGRPDLGFMTMTEMVNRAAYISEAVSIPVIADADTGFGNALNMMRTVKEYERVGVSAMQIEDQVFPKKCGHMANKELIPANEMENKIKAALDARVDPNFLIIARTDARGVIDIEEALERAQRYKEAGADIIFVEAPQSLEEMKLITSKIKAYHIANMVEGGKTPMVEASELRNLGFQIAIFPNAVTRFIVPQVHEFLTNLKSKGTTKDFHDQMYMFNELNELVGLPYYERLNQKYSE